MLTLYSTNCPKCLVLEKKLKEKKLEFTVVNDIHVMIDKGFMEAPILEVNGNYMNFVDACKWLKEE